MTDEGKDADLRPGGPAPDSVRTHPPDSPRTPGRPPGDPRGAGGGRGNLSVQTRDRLATQLRAMYDTVAQQPVPDRFAELIARLDTADRK